MLDCSGGGKACVVSLPLVETAQLHRIPGIAVAWLCLFWTVWRIWRFTALPYLYPHRPKELPYCIPFIGHGFSFFQSSDALLAHASAYFGTREPFSLTVFGNTLHIVTDPQHTKQVYKNNETLSFESFVQDLFRSNGYSSAALKATYTRLPKDKPGFPNPSGVSFGSFVQKMHMHQLYAGKELSQLEQNFCTWFDQSLCFRTLKTACSQYGTVNLDGSLELPLGQWCDLLITRSGEFAYFGDALSRVNPDLAQDFLVFDELGWQVLYQYPSFLSRKMARARSQVQRTFERYLQIPPDRRAEGGAVWLINAMETEARALGVGDDDIAILLFNIYWVISTNTRKIAFWMVTFLLHTPSLVEAVREEIAPAFRGDKIFDKEYLWTQCPLLDGIWHETLRLCSNAASVRHVDQDSVIGGKIFRQGDRIMIPYRLLHFDPDVYGHDSRSFRPERFMGGKIGALTRSPSWRPFGGGKTLCTGRHAAKHTTLIFIATLLRRFDVEKVGAVGLPEVDLGRPVLGISAVKEGQDYKVKIRPRKL